MSPGDLLILGDLVSLLGLPVWLSEILNPFLHQSSSQFPQDPSFSRLLGILFPLIHTGWTHPVSGGLATYLSPTPIPPVPFLSKINTLSSDLLIYLLTNGLVGDRVSCSLVLPLSHNVAKVGLDLPILLSLYPESWNFQECINIPSSWVKI